MSLLWHIRDAGASPTVACQLLCCLSDKACDFAALTAYRSPACLVFGHFALGWLTKGLIPGARKATLNAQVSANKCYLQPTPPYKSMCMFKLETHLDCQASTHMECAWHLAAAAQAHDNSIDVLLGCMSLDT